MFMALEAEGVIRARPAHPGGGPSAHPEMGKRRPLEIHHVFLEENICFLGNLART